MADLVLAAAAVTLVLIFFRVRRAGRSYAILREWEEESLAAVPLTPAPSFGVSLEDMNGMVNELAPTLRPASRVAAPQSSAFPNQSAAEAGHIWSSPCGKRVYIN